MWYHEWNGHVIGYGMTISIRSWYVLKICYFHIFERNQKWLHSVGQNVHQFNKWKMKMKIRVTHDIGETMWTELKNENTNEQSTSNSTYKQLIYSCECVIIDSMYYHFTCSMLNYSILPFSDCLCQYPQPEYIVSHTLMISYCFDFNFVSSIYVFIAFWSFLFVYVFFPVFAEILITFEAYSNKVSQRI